MSGHAKVIRVMVLDDQPGPRESMAAILNGSPGFTCVGAHPNGAVALCRIPIEQPDVILVDLEMPGMSGTQFIGTCRSRFAEVELLVLTLHDEARWVFPALSAGASGYLVKDTPVVKILDAIETLAAGGSFMSSQVARLVLKRFQGEPLTEDNPAKLSPRENEVLELLSKGLRYDEIAENLGIKPRTVNTHLQRAYSKLHVHSGPGAVSKFLNSFSSRLPYPE